MYVKRTSCTPDETPLAQLIKEFELPEEAAMVAVRRYSCSAIEALALVWVLRRIVNGEP